MGEYKTDRANTRASRIGKSAKKLSVISKILSHAGIILSIMYIVLYFIDRVNNAMEFINHDITKALILALAIICIVSSEITLYTLSKKQKRGKK